MSAALSAVWDEHSVELNRYAVVVFRFFAFNLSIRLHFAVVNVEISDL